MKKNPNRITKTNKIYLDGKEVAELQQGGIKFKRQYIFTIQDITKIIILYEERKKWS